MRIETTVTLYNFIQRCGGLYTLEFLTYRAWSAVTDGSVYWSIARCTYLSNQAIWRKIALVLMDEP
jgi:hypothetical protein